MFYSKRLKRASAILGVMAAGTIATAALASPPSGVTPTVFATGELANEVHLNSDRVKFQTKDSATVRVQRLVFAPGAYSGWHHHPGVTVVVVESGSLTLTQGDCSATTYNAGQVFAEGGDEPHNASTAGGATVYVTYVVPTGEAAVFREEDDAQVC